ncbi:invadolysin (M08 family), partial [Schistosoma japonicum]
LMASSTEVDSFASKVTFAYFEDSGIGTKLIMKNLKMDLWQKSWLYIHYAKLYAYASVKRMKHENILPFCDQPNIVMCRDDYSYGICAIGMYTNPLLPEDQFFDNKSFAGDKSDYYG